MSAKMFITEILAAHADQLLKQEDCTEAYISLFPEEAELPRLLTLADHVKAALEPVHPNQDFRQQLHQDLMAAHNLRVAARPTMRPSIIGAFLAVLGLFFVFWHHQTQQN